MNDEFSVEPRRGGIIIEMNDELWVKPRRGDIIKQLRISNYELRERN
jgi:hypothetical protein